MKKIFLLFILFFSLYFPTFACEYSVNPLQQTGVTNAKLNIRNAPCSKNTDIFSVTKIWETYKITWETEKYYQIDYNGKKAFIWKDWVDIIQQQKKSLLSKVEKNIVQNIAQKIKKQSPKKQKQFIEQIKKLQKNTKNTKKISEIFTTLLEVIGQPIPKLKKSEPKKVETKKQEIKKTSKIEKQKAEKKQATKKNLKIPNTGISNFSKTETDAVAKYWLQLYNSYRAKQGLKPYKYDARLQKSAEKWSKISANRGYWSHKRNPKTDGFYDFWKIQKWFKNNGVNCKIQNQTGAVENVGVGRLYCKKANCSAELKRLVKKTFDFYMREKGKRYRPHYKSIINKNLHFMGFGIYKRKIKNGVYQVYNTTHFCTNFK